MDAVAKRLRRSKSAVSRIETGNSSIAADDLPSTLRAYALTVDDFAAAAKAA